MKTKIKQFSLAVVMVLFAFNSTAFIVLPGAITHNMVLQQKDVTTLWGKASPGKTITIITSWNTQQYKTAIDGQGHWKIKIKTPVAGGPYTISFNDGELLTLNNVMIGEVWLCSGQSNMEMPVGGWGKVMDYQAEITRANYPMIRLLKVKKTISSYPLDDFKSNTMGWQECSPSTITEFSAAAYFFARKLFQTRPVAIGLIDATWGGTVVEAWTSEEAIVKVPAFADTVKMIAALPHDTKLTNPNKPALLFNGMINPFLPLAFKGVIWYQGESNNSRAYQYRELFPLMINDWRHKFNRPQMPFIFVQLAAFHPIKPETGESTWAELREAQAMALTLPNTGMAVAIDLGEADNIHPKNKQEVGNRLALVALAKCYNEKVVYKGPVYQRSKVSGEQIIIHFNPGAEKLQGRNGADITGFAIAGADRIFYWATAEIKGNTIVVSAKNVTKPVAVRYAWADNPVCNLVNNAGLPAAPFRTDDWPVSTVNKK